VPAPTECFLDSATRDFGDNAELQIIARRELEEAILNAPEAGDSLDAMRARFDAVDARPGKFRAWLLAAMAVTSLALFAWNVCYFYTKRHEVEWIESAGSLMPYDIPAENLTVGLTPSQKLLLLGDPEALPEGNRMKALWQSDPGNPIFFAEHARTWVAKCKSMPVELWETARRLDPDNGYFHYLAATVAADKCVEDIDKPRKKGEPPPLNEYRILDEARWNQALDHLHAAAAAPAFQSHEKELLLRRLELLPVPVDILSNTPKSDYIFGGGRTTISDFSLYRVVSAKAEACLKQSDREGFLKLVETWDRLLPRLSESSRPLLMRTLILRGFAGAPLDNFIAAAEGLDLPELAGKLRSRKELLAQEHSPIQQAIRNDEAKRQVKLHGGLFQEYYFYPGIPREEEMRASRLAEYALMDRVAALAGWTIFAFMTLSVACYRFRASGVLKRVSRRLSHLVTQRDLLQVAAGGNLLPFMLSLAVIHFTPLGGRGWNFHAHGGLIVVGQLLAVVLLMLLVPMVLARRQLSCRAGRLGLHSGSSTFGWLAVAACVFAIPVFYIAQWVTVPERLMGSDSFLGASSFIDLDPGEASAPGRIWLRVAIGLLAAAAAYGAVTLLRSLFCRRQHLLRRVILSRMLVLPYVSGTLLFALAMPTYHTVERFWFARDATVKFLPEDFGLTPAEARLQQLDQEQILGVLERGH
jgi:hypothetical protein